MSSSMLTTSPGRLARQRRRRMARMSSRATRPWRPISPEAGSICQSPMRSLVVGCWAIRISNGRGLIPFLGRTDGPGKLYAPIWGARLELAVNPWRFQNDSGGFRGRSGLRAVIRGSVRSICGVERKGRRSGKRPRLEGRKGCEGMDSGNGVAREGNGVAAIGIAGFVAGTLDILQACILFGWEIPKVIAAGLLGPGVIAGGGAGVYMLGLVLHYV